MLRFANGSNGYKSSLILILVGRDVPPERL